MANGVILAGSIHGLKDDQDRETIVGVESLLTLTQSFEIFLKEVFGMIPEVIKVPLRFSIRPAGTESI